MRAGSPLEDAGVIPAGASSFPATFNLEDTMIRYTIAALGLLLCLAAPAAAQTSVCTGTPPNTVCTGPIDASMRFEWQAPDNVATAAAAIAMEPRIRVDGATAFTALAGETCTGTAVPFTCTATIPAALLPLLNAAGNHSVTMHIYDPATMLESTAAVPFVLRSPPAAATGLRIVRST